MIIIIIISIIIIVRNCCIPFMGLRGFVTGANRSYLSGRRQGTPWTSRQLIAGLHWWQRPPLRHAARLSPELGFEQATFWSLADLHYLLSYSRHLYYYYLLLICHSTDLMLALYSKSKFSAKCSEFWLWFKSSKLQLPWQCLIVLCTEPSWFSRSPLIYFWFVCPASGPLFLSILA